MVGRDRTGCPVGERSTVGRFGGATCGAVGFAVAVAALAVGYPVVVAVTSVLPLLSTTAIVFVWAFAWLATWFALLVGLTLVRSRIGGQDARLRRSA